MHQVKVNKLHFSHSQKFLEIMNPTKDLQISASVQFAGPWIHVKTSDLETLKNDLFLSYFLRVSFPRPYSRRQILVCSSPSLSLVARLTQVALQSTFPESSLWSTSPTKFQTPFVFLVIYRGARFRQQSIEKRTRLLITKRFGSIFLGTERNQREWVIITFFFN